MGRTWSLSLRGSRAILITLLLRSVISCSSNQRFTPWSTSTSRASVSAKSTASIPSSTSAKPQSPSFSPRLRSPIHDDATLALSCESETKARHALALGQRGSVTYTMYPATWYGQPVRRCSARHDYESSRMCLCSRWLPLSWLMARVGDHELSHVYGESE